MTEQGVVGTRWLLRALLVVGAGLLLAVLGFSTSAHAAEDAPGQDDAATTEPSTPVDDPVPAGPTTRYASRGRDDACSPPSRSWTRPSRPSRSWRCSNRRRRCPRCSSAPELPSDLPPEVDAPATPLPAVVDVRAAEVVGTLTPSSAPAFDALRSPVPELSHPVPSARRGAPPEDTGRR